MRTIRKLAVMSVLTSVSLIIFMLELLVPPVLPVAGAKLGLANVIIVFALYSDGVRFIEELNNRDVFMIVLSRVLLGGIVTGRVSALLYSMTGGVLCYGVMVLLRRVIGFRQMWALSAIGGAVHNIAQVFVAVLITQTVETALYTPVLIIAGLVSGMITGTLAYSALRLMSS